MHSKWFAIIISCCVMLSFALLPVSPTAARAVGRSNAPASGTKRTPVRCTHRNKASGTIRYSDASFPSTLNPNQTSEPAAQLTTSAMFDDLARYNNRGVLMPMMLVRIPTLKNGGIRNSGKTIVLQLKPGLRWSNNTEITARDIWFAWKVESDPNSGPACAGTCDVIRSITTPSRYVAVLHLKRVYASAVPEAFPGVEVRKWPNAWKTDDWHTAALKLYRDPSFNFTNASYPTDGPYQVSSFNPGQRIVLQPMKYYDDMTCGGYIQNLIFESYPSKQSMIAAATKDETDVTQNYTMADIGGLKRGSRGYTLHTDPGFIYEHLEFNLDSRYKGKANPVSDRNVRVALALALDNIGLIQRVSGASRKAALNVAAWTPWLKTPHLVQQFANQRIRGQWDPIAKHYLIPGSGNALKDAKKLLSRTRWKRGFTLNLFTVSGNPVRKLQAGILQHDWARIGVKLHVHYQSLTSLLADWGDGGTLDHGAFQAAMFLWFNDPDPDLFKYQMQSRYVDRRTRSHSDVNQNYSGISDRIIDRSFKTAAGTLDATTRTRAYHAIQTEMNKQAYWIGLYYGPALATSNSHLTGFLNNPTSAGVTWNVYAWKVRS